MKKTITCLALLLSTLTLSFAEETKPSVQLIEVLEFKKTFIDAAKAEFAPLVQSLKQNGVDDASIQKVNKASNEFVMSVADDPGLINDMASIYDANYTQEEILELVAFYKTPLGRKTLKVEPIIAQEGMHVGEKYAAKYLPTFEETVTKIIMESQTPQIVEPGM